MQKHVNLVDLVKSFPTCKIWRRCKRERALQSLIIWLRNQSKIRYRTFQLRKRPGSRVSGSGEGARPVPAAAARERNYAKTLSSSVNTSGTFENMARCRLYRHRCLLFFCAIHFQYISRSTVAPIGRKKVRALLFFRKKRTFGGEGGRSNLSTG